MCYAVFPNGICTGLDIGLSNFSLALITLSFYTMCKSTVPVFLLGFAFLWGIERYAASSNHNLLVIGSLQSCMPLILFVCNRRCTVQSQLSVPHISFDLSPCGILSK